MHILCTTCVVRENCCLTMLPLILIETESQLMHDCILPSSLDMKRCIFIKTPLKLHFNKATFRQMFSYKYTYIHSLKKLI